MTVDRVTKPVGSSISSRRRSLAAAAVGNALEWFDWTLYGTFSVYLAANLFVAGDPTSALLSTLAVFAVGFVARPIGGLVFGRLGDRLGRKTAMMVTMSTLAVSSLALAALPTFEQVGALAGLLLLVVRMVQGLAHGGEVGISSVYVAELAPPAHRGLWSSSVYIGLTVGVMLATAIAATLTSVLSGDEMLNWGWRVAFALGGVLGIFVLYLRRTAVETDIFAAEETADEESMASSSKAASDIDLAPSAARTPKRQIVGIALRIMMFSVGLNVSYYVWITFAPTNAIAQHDMDPSAAFAVSLGAQALMLVLLPLFGALSDRIGRRPFVFAQGLLMIVLAFPISGLVSDAPWTLFLAVLLGSIIWGLVGAVYSALLAEQAPTRLRATIVSFMTSLGVAIFGGTGPYLNTWLTSIGYGWVYTVYIMALGAVVIVAGLLIRETKGTDLTKVGSDLL